MSKRAEDAALKAYPHFTSENIDEVIRARELFHRGYEQAEQDIIKHCDKRITEYNAQNLSNMFLRRAFGDVIQFIKDIPYNDYKDEDHE